MSTRNDPFPLCLGAWVHFDRVSYWNLRKIGDAPVTMASFTIHVRNQIAAREINLLHYENIIPVLISSGNCRLRQINCATVGHF